MTSGRRSCTSRMIRPMIGYVPLFLAAPDMLKCSTLSVCVAAASVDSCPSARGVAVGPKTVAASTSATTIPCLMAIIDPP